MSNQLQNLSEQFNTLLTQYTNTYNDYINAVSSNNNTFTTVPDSSFAGQNIINTTSNSTLDACQTTCTSNSSCSGATFSPNNDCTISSGTGNIVSAPQSTAIVNQALYYSYQLQQLNSQLTNINQQMMNISNSSYSEYQQTQQKTQQQEQALQNNYQVLTQERENINEMIRQFETINSAYENGSLNVTSNYYSFVLLFIFAIILVFILLNFSFTGQQRGGGKYMRQSFFLLILIVIVVFIIICLKNNK